MKWVRSIIVRINDITITLQHRNFQIMIYRKVHEPKATCDQKDQKSGNHAT